MLRPLIEDALSREDSGFWLDRLARAGIPSGRVRSVKEALDHPQVVARGMRVTADSAVGPLPVFRAPFEAAAGGERHIPELGEHTDIVLEQLRYTPAEISRLRESGTVL
ncbi:CoA transferase [Blastococcus brunescens]|uniref:CoA transferase n=1 Tax=Blastococcus brunescens TaxID=1564165 RepID=A0ABZ1AYK6_9ACTN|nr:CoA transferase [Blastococcus sp. BMG 8361]WRL63605.1 CoA transferase [Blastococcus sp. BMG 8361]